MANNTRQSTLALDLGGEQILLERVEAVEALSRPFAITVDFLSELGDIDLLPHLGKPACVTVRHDDDALRRHFHGYVAEGEFLTETDDDLRYRIVLRPFTHFMSFNREFRIFYKMTAMDIIKKVIEESGFSAAIEKVATGSPLVREYCTQYGESNFAFISRLMEEEGIYYFFRHAAGGHKMVLCEKPSDHAAGKAPTLTYNASSVGKTFAEAAGTTIQRWHERVATGSETKVTLRDFDFEKPAEPLQQVVTAGGEDRFPAEVYEWPGPYIDPAHGKRLAETILEARRGEQRLFSGESQLSALEIGTKVTIKGHAAARYNREVVITRTHHVMLPETYRSGRDAGAQDVTFDAIPADTKWRAPPLTPRPVVRGPETAIVVGVPNETIHTDSYGRIQVRFHWDRSGEKVENMTCWLRVSQTGGLGNVILPRVGHEVIVDFLDGDPDRPVVVGRVFNERNKPIYPLPENKTRALWRSLTYTSKGGADDVGAAVALDTANPGANEIRFEDKIGKEELFFHAQRDLATRVRRTETHFVGLDQDVQIHGARKTVIDQNDELTVKASQKVDVTNTIEIKAGTSITLKVGDNSIVIDQKGITMKGTMIAIEGTAKLDAKSPLTTLAGDGKMTITGGMVMIN